MWRIYIRPHFRSSHLPTSKIIRPFATYRHGDTSILRNIYAEQRRTTQQVARSRADADRWLFPVALQNAFYCRALVGAGTIQRRTPWVFGIRLKNVFVRRPHTKCFGDFFSDADAGRRVSRLFSRRSLVNHGVHARRALLTTRGPGTGK